MWPKLAVHASALLATGFSKINLHIFHRLILRMIIIAVQAHCALR